MDRRAFLLGGTAAVAAAGAGAWVTEGPRIRRALHLVVAAPDPVPDIPTGQLLSGSFRSAAMRRTTGWSLAYPPGASSHARLPVLLTFHGRTGNHRDAFDVNHDDRFLAAAVRSGVPPFAIASVDGGDHSYFHARADGSDPERMILDELLPLLAKRGLHTDRIGLHGVSMGGYGALLLAERLGPGRVAVVAADAPAIWQRWQDSAPGAFDGKQDFADHDVLKHCDALRAIPTRITVGTDDPFRSGVTAMLKRLPSAESEVGPGAHNARWWRHAAPQQLAFIGKHLPR
ncbi:MAG: putative esterase [Frankiales bacterium]|nr:putative esterase [Frankiales bacterium]